VLVSREERLARNESLFREVNEHIAEAARRTLVLPEAEFLCECGRPECLERIVVPLGEYEHVRAHADRFLLVAGHEQAEVDKVVGGGTAYVIVRKIGQAGDIAADLDPRS
jgi:hypothetical protein